jgi:DNA-binding transcriptional MerR regulator
MEQLTVSRLAGEVGTTPDTVRYYERIGLLAPPQRSAAGYRLYDPGAVERVRFIKRAQRFGLRLSDIADLVAVRDRGLCPCGGTRQLLEARMAELDEEMAALRRLRADIAGMLADRRFDRADGVSACGPLCGPGATEPAGGRAPIGSPVSLTSIRARHDRQRKET